MKYFVWFGATVALLVANTWVSAATKPEPRISVAVKPKREAPLSSTSSSYHGPSYKYLPPAPASVGISANGYDSYSSHGSSSAGFGAGGGAGIGYDFGGGAFHSSAPKVETYIVQTEPAHGGYIGAVSSHGGAAYSGSGDSGEHSHSGATYSGSGGSSQHSHAGHIGAGYSGSGGSGQHSHAGHSSAAGGGYRYTSGVSQFQAGASALLGHSSFGGGGGGGGGGGSYKFRNKARPHTQTFIIPASALTHGAGGSGSGGIHSSASFSGGHAVHSNGGSSNSVEFGSDGYQYELPTFGSSLHSGAGGFGSAHGSNFGGGHSGSVSFGGLSGSGFGAHGSNSLTYNPQQGYSYSGHGGSGNGLNSKALSAQATGHIGSGATLSFANHGDYSGHEYAQSAPSIPSTNYGVPVGSALPAYQGAGDAYYSNGYETPSYALGHKGLGHFSFSASKPQALNTKFSASGKSAHFDNSGQAPFKPSTLLGTAHEVSGPAAQYLPPTSPGYEYQSPSVLHGGASATINQPASAYLSPVATPGSTYLPPNQH